MSRKTLDITVVPDRSLFALQTPAVRLLSRFPGEQLMSQAGITTRTGLKWSAGRSTSRVSSLLVVGLLIFAAGFSEEKDTKAITDALNQSTNKDSIKLVYMIGRVSGKCGSFTELDPIPAQIDFIAAQKAGLVTIVPDGPGFWNVELANAKPQVLENLKKAKYNETDGCRSLTMFDTVATKSVVEVKRINKLINQKSEVEFTWKWTLAPTGIKLIDSLSQKQLSQLNDNLRNPALLMKHDDTFNLTDIRQSTTPQAAKKMLKKSGESWVVDQ
jgi:hypothetical protein